MSAQPSHPGPTAGERPNLSPQSFVASSVERLFFRVYVVIIPAVLLLRIGFEYAYFGTAPELLVDQIKILVEVCILCFIALFNHGCTTVPVLLQQLFSAAGPIELRPGQPSPGSFLRHLQADLNSPYRLILAVLAALITLGYYIIRIGGLGRLFAVNTFSLYYYFFAYMIPAVVYAYFIGIALWKIAVVIIRVQQIPRRFRLQVDFGHPDQANGLLPVGQIALKLAYIFAAPSVVSAFILIGPFLRYVTGSSIPAANQGIVFGFSGLVLLFALVGILAVIRLILKYRRVILAQKHRVVQQLNAISAEIAHLRSKTITLVGSEAQATLPDYLEQIELLEKLYQKNAAINTWPLNRQSLIEIWATLTFVGGQILALWQLVTGL